MAGSLDTAWKRAQTLSGLGAPVLLMIILAMIVIPLAPFVLDLLFTFNIALAIVWPLGLPGARLSRVYPETA